MKSPPSTLCPPSHTLCPRHHAPHPTPYTLHLSPYTFHPTPYTPHPTPYTLHPTPYTLHTTPFTLHPTTYTPHPKLETLNPKPSSSGVLERTLRFCWWIIVLMKKIKIAHDHHRIGHNQAILSSKRTNLRHNWTRSTILFEIWVRKWFHRHEKILKRGADPA